VAVQIIANLYHSFPTQRTVIVTHSNAALNDIFDKVMTRGDVDERYMLRLGSGEKNLTTTSSSEHDFTKVGRVAHIMSRRGDLLEKVQQLSEALGVSGKAERGADGAPSYTSETSEYFFFHHVKPRIDSFEKATLADKGEGTNNVISTFPFTQYFPELTETSTTLSPDAAMEKISQLKAVFTELAEYRPIELLRSQRQRTDYLLTSQAKIVAMTCTHAAIARSHLVDLGFHYDNVIMEEAGQMLDVETFVPLLLQRGESDSTSAGSHSRLKRVCLIGDHNQLPPVVKNQSFSRYSHYDQSCFARLIRLGVPSIELDKQGRSRPEIARLFSWRYDDLGDLGHVSTKDVFKRANTGLALPYQLINVEDFEVS
jgi:intron-binding protein aquarius